MSDSGPNRGEVWWMEHPDTGRRPACILTRQAAIPVLQTLLVAPASTRARGIPTEVRLGPEDGMPRECVLTLDNVGPVRKVLLTERITRLGPVNLAELCAALKLAAGC
jgi:mRNA interferase MazF